jgi:FkbM family methyltransferase
MMINLEKNKSIFFAQCENLQPSNSLIIGNESFDLIENGIKLIHELKLKSNFNFNKKSDLYIVDNITDNQERYYNIRSYWEKVFNVYIVNKNDINFLEVLKLTSVDEFDLIINYDEKIKETNLKSKILMPFIDGEFKSSSTIEDKITDSVPLQEMDLNLKSNKIEHFYTTVESENWFGYEEVYSNMVSHFGDGSHFVEVGVWKGMSACFMAVEIINSGKNIKFDCVDTWEYVETSSEISESQFVNLFKIFEKNIEPVKNNIGIVKSLSWDGAKFYDDESLDFVFIDAAHDYESVTKDLESWFPKVKKSGVIAGHAYHYDCGVYPAVNKFFKNYEIKQIGACWIVDLSSKLERPVKSESNNNLEYFSQLGQDRFIDEYYNKKENGIFLDIGAHDGKTLSNTYFLEKMRNWKGICVEAQPVLFEDLNKNRNSINLNCAISNHNGEIEFTFVDGYANMLSGISDDYNDTHRNRILSEVERHGGCINKIIVKSRKLQDVLDEYGIYDIDFCSIDTEGSEFRIVQSIDFTKTNIKVFIIENNYQDTTIKNFLEENGYYLHSKIQWDDVFVKKEQEEIIKVSHDAGFFSVCNINLLQVLNYYNSNKKFCRLDTSNQWNLYKDESIDVYPKFFKYSTDSFETHPQSYLESDNEIQFSNYKLLNFNFINPFIKKYFNFSDEVLLIEQNLINKYQINFDETISICYRGGGKIRETNLPSYEEILAKLIEVRNIHPNCKIIVQSDEIEFCDYIKSYYNDVIIFEETIKLKKSDCSAVQYHTPHGKRVETAQNFLAVMSIMSKSRSIILNSGSVGMFVCLFRGNSNDVHQYLSPKGTNEVYWY